jgi:T-complex protein 1 subunit delta
MFLAAQMDNQVVISDYAQMDRVLREERQYIVNMCKKIQKSGCNVLLIQKSILRDAVSDLSLHFLAKLKIMVVRDIERDEVEFICRTLGCQPIASIDSFTPDRLGSAQLVEEMPTSESGKVLFIYLLFFLFHIIFLPKVIKVTGVPSTGKTVSVLVRGANVLLVDEAERSLHDALCVVRALVKKRFLMPGGGAAETEISIQLHEWSKTLTGVKSICVKAFAEAFEVIPYTLAENAGLNPIQVVTELRKAHLEGQQHAGINMRKATHAQGKISDMVEKKVISPLLVHTSMIDLATDTVALIMKIDGIVQTR